MAGLVGEDQDFRGSGDHVDADLAEDETLGRRDIGIAGTNDFRDRRDGLRAICQGGDGLRATHAIDLVDAGKLRRRQHQRRELALRRRHRHHQPRHAGDLRRHGVHQHRGRIGGAPSGHIKAHGLDCGPARPKLDAQRIDEALVRRDLPPVIGLDAIARECEGIERPRLANLVRGIDLVGTQLEPALVEIEAVEAAREFDQGAVAASRDIGDDCARGRLDIGGRFTLGGEKRVETLGEIRRAAVEADRHGPVLPDHTGRIGGQ